MDRALSPGRFIRYRQGASFVRGLRGVARDLERRVEAGHADQAADLYRTFIGACHEKAREMDDSGGELGQFVQDLFVAWLRAQQAAAIPAPEAIQALVSWMDHDEFGFCYEIEREVAPAMGPEYLAHFVAVARFRLAGSPPDDGSVGGAPRRQWTAILRTLLAAQGDADGYRRHCEASGGVTAADCDALAEIHERAGRLEAALAWVERGRGASRSGATGSLAAHELYERHLSLLQRLGRADEALAEVWTHFARDPSSYGYDELMERAPAAEKASWHERAVAVAEAARLRASMETLLKAGEPGRLAHRLQHEPDHELRELDPYAISPVARALERSQPAAAARLHRIAAENILDEAVSRQYGHALRHLERARECYHASGQEAAWAELVEHLRRQHRRKIRFMPGLERVARGEPARPPRPSLVAQAKRRRFR